MMILVMIMMVVMMMSTVMMMIMVVVVMMIMTTMMMMMVVMVTTTMGEGVNKVARVEGRSWFQSEGPMIAKAKSSLAGQRDHDGQVSVADEERWW